MQHSALRIYKGTHGAPPDERPLISVGEVPDTFSPIVPSLIDEPETWVLIHRYDYTLYVYQVTQEDTTYRQICLLVPVGIRLSVDNNPYGLLLELWGMLESRGSQNALFEDRLASCISGEHASDTHLPVMDGQRPASFCADSRMQVKALLTFSQYPQLARVSRLEIGLHCASTIFLPIKANVKKVVQSEPVHQPKSDKSIVAPSVNEKTKGKQPGRRRNVGKKVALYAFLLVVVVAVVGFVLSAMEDSSGTSNIVLSTDSLVVKENPLVAKEKTDVISDTDTIGLVIDSVPYNLTKREKEERVREEILELVNRKDLKGCRNHRGWEFLSKEERWAVEAILGYRYKEYRELRGPGRVRIERLMKKSFPFRSFDEIITTRKKMVKIIAEYGRKTYAFKF